MAFTVKRKVERCNNIIMILQSFMAEYKAVADLAKKEEVNHRELWRSYLEQRKEVLNVGR